MSIEELWRLAVEEFGEVAYKIFEAVTRFEAMMALPDLRTGLSRCEIDFKDDYQFNNNEEALFCLECRHGVINERTGNSREEFSLKPIPDLIAHGIEYHGDDEYLMWMWNKKPNNKGDVCFCDNNDLIDHLEMDYDLIRKTSADLSFDHERAKSGDVVYFIHEDGKLEIIPTGELYLLRGMEKKLRMKYPPKATQ